MRIMMVANISCCLSVCVCLCLSVYMSMCVSMLCMCVYACGMRMQSDNHRAISPEELYEAVGNASGHKSAADSGAGASASGGE